MASNYYNIYKTVFQIRQNNCFKHKVGVKVVVRFIILGFYIVKVLSCNHRVSYTKALGCNQLVVTKNVGVSKK